MIRKTINFLQLGSLGSLKSNSKAVLESSQRGCKSPGKTIYRHKLRNLLYIKKKFSKCLALYLFKAELLEELRFGF